MKNISLATVPCLLLAFGCASERNEEPYWDGQQAFRGDVRLERCDLTPERDDVATNRAAVSLERCAFPGPEDTTTAVCGDLAADNELTLLSGSLVVAGSSRIAAPLRVEAGSFTGHRGIRADNTQDVSGDLATEGDWVVSSPAHVGGDAFIGGTLDARNAVQVDGTLHVAEAITDNVSAGDVATRSVDVPAPLACQLAPSVRAQIERAKDRGYYDAGFGLAPLREEARITLGCDRYRFDSLDIGNELVVYVDGPTVVIVDGDVRVSSPVRFEIADGASLDLLIGGSLEVDNQLSFTGADTWLAVAGQVRIAAPMTLDGWLYAPGSSVAADNTLDVNGALLAGSLRVASPVTIGPWLDRQANDALASCDDRVDEPR